MSSLTGFLSAMVNLREQSLEEALDKVTVRLRDIGIYTEGAIIAPV
jgi:hypothetical protein